MLLLGPATVFRFYFGRWAAHSKTERSCGTRHFEADVGSSPGTSTRAAPWIVIDGA